ncbi:MAG TPA: hypothetical protein G4O02_17650 [Caldilineae bacterium]|nr:hypothetical protein [Caldilineae bacterium]
MKVERLPDNPIITPDIGSLEGNINGPSLIRVPDWLPNPLGRYYLYFAHHKGKYIRLAYADRLEGPWTVYEPGTLRVEESYCFDHVASPDVHVDEERREIRMYYHGPVAEAEIRDQQSAAYPFLGRQRSRVALSRDELHFTARPEILGASYFRVFRWRGDYYALGMPGIFYRSRDGLTGFEQGPTLFTPDMRHSAVLVRGDTLYVFYSNVGDSPERILLSTIELTDDWMQWCASDPITVLEPEMEYEGAHLPLEPSVRGWAPQPVHQLRDPTLYQEGDETYLLYSVAGEQGIAIARIVEW